METIRRILGNVRGQFKHLSVTQGLLLGALCLLLLMTWVLVSLYAGSPTQVALFPGGSAEEQQKAAAFLSEHDMGYKLGADGKVMVSREQKWAAIGAMTKAQALPGDKKIMFSDAVIQTSWLESREDKLMRQTYALQNELAAIIRTIPGIEGAGVVVSRPPTEGGIGASAKKAVAQVSVSPIGGQGLDQGTVNALADLVAGSVSGLDVRDVAVVDLKNRRSYRAVSADDLASGGGSYLEQAVRVEKRVQEKIAEHLGNFIPGVIVSVNAIVDAARRDSTTIKALDKGHGTVAIPEEENSTTNTSESTNKSGAEPFNSNFPMDINRAGGGTGSKTSEETSRVKNAVMIGEQRTTERGATGKPTKINVTVSVPREYVAQIVKQKKSAAAPGAGGAAPGGGASAEPSDGDINNEWESSVKGKIEEMITPLVETEGAPDAAPGAAAQLVAGTVKAFLIPVSIAGAGAMGGTHAGFLVGGESSMGGIGKLLDGGLVKTGVLGLLALVALGLMFTMVRKAGKASPLPTAEELVGIPPALEPGSDLVGEAEETETAMQGIEIDDDSLKTSKMLEEIGTLVKSNPQTAASVFNRWLTEEE